MLSLKDIQRKYKIVKMFRVENSMYRIETAEGQTFIGKISPRVLTGKRISSRIISDKTTVIIK
jgi:hypothetical protein